MPIDGLTTQRRLPRLGKIRLGIKAISQNGREYPKAVDYFVVPPEVGEIYGPEPRTLDIILPVDSEELLASTFYKAYSASRGLVCKGDGLSANRLIDTGQKAVEPGTGVITGPIAGRNAQATEWALGITCPGRECPYYGEKQCRELMSLQFMMPNVPGLGVWQLDTSSYHSIVNIYSGMELVRGIFGTVAMIPLTLSLEPMEVSPEGQKKTVHVLHLRSKGTLAQIAEQRAQPLVPSLIPAPDEEREELLFPENGFEPAAAVSAPVAAPPKKPPPAAPRTTVVPSPNPKPKGKLGDCEEHGRAWGTAADNRIGHPLGNGRWCWQDEQNASEPEPEPEAPAPSEAAVAETVMAGAATVQDGAPAEPQTREGLEGYLAALGWDWEGFQDEVLRMPWSEWEKLAEDKSVEKALVRFQNLDPVPVV